MILTMKKFGIMAVSFAAGILFGAETPALPQGPLGIKKELLFSDDFQDAGPTNLWHKVVPHFVVTNGMLVGGQVREKDVTAPNGSVTKAHAAVHGLELPTKDTIIEVKIRLDGASMVDIEFDDRKYTNSHYGHLCRAQFRTNGVTLIDERDGGMRLDIRAMIRDPAKKEERAKLLVGRQITIPHKIESGKWHTVVLETIGEAMRASVNGTAVAYLKSSGIGHRTKSKIEFGVAGKYGALDDLKIWNAAANP